MKPWRPCVACGAAQAVLMAERDGFHIVECTSCGLVYVGEDPADIDFEALYDAQYYRADATDVTDSTGAAEPAVPSAGQDGNRSKDAEDTTATRKQTKGFADYFGQAASRRAAARRRLWSLRRLVPRGRLLDVGCAAGYFLAEARSSYSVQGVELSDFSADFARKEFGLDVFTGTLADAALPSAHFDLVTLWDVIEHVSEPGAVLAEVARVLAPRGRVVLTTGDIGSAYAQQRGAQWHLMTPPWHLYFFSRQSFSRLAAKAGLRVVHVASRGVAGDGRWARSKPGLLLNHWLDRGDIMQLTLAHSA